MSLSPIFAILLGNILEFYDFMLFAHLSSVLGPKFFPAENEFISHLMGLGMFALGYFARPVGAIIFGIIGDKLGRKIAITKSILIISLPTLIIALLPTYHQIGIIAPIILIIVRCIQGIAMGGEYSNAGILLIENYPRHRFLLSCLLCASCQIGSILALGICYIIIAYQEIEWLWRIAFVIGFILGIVSYYLRKILRESISFTQTKQEEKFKEVFRDKISFLSITIFAGLIGILVWMPITFTNFYSNKYLHLGSTYSIKVTLVAVFSYIIALTSLGLLFNRYFSNNIRAILLMMFGASGLACLSAVPLFTLLTQHHLFLFQILITVLAAAFGGGIHQVACKLTNSAVRSRAVSLSFALGISIFGSTSPIIATWLIETTQNHISPSFYVMLISFLSCLMIGLLFKKKFKSV
ncbi:MFS transporter [Rickettsiales endosymbiont of Stachyamoeba lipophora]|uniref:MFS transporter n=1 Tax=Rickettsiales endosymbiont of Stachyamoeba lipophora TaxID=2486578 RepID=UPI000F64959B|nr:MFS transporter [Rickettsiales endosymbiont of Stachyamoeba lipophora]AZL16125.1 MFS transporter [Rickettsiales endosymbiont of Stachyamoeba lipophora]